MKEIQALVCEAIQKESELIARIEPKNLYLPVSYSLNMGGKRIRPVMVLLAHSLFQNDCERALPAAMAIEVFHNFTLLHDDIMDRADMRRGKPAVHKQFNENAAILSGDAMSIMAYQYILKTDLPDIRPLAQLFSRTAIEICEGQQYDMDFESRLDVTIDEYLQMIKLKTAVLLACSLKAGALTAQADIQQAELLYDTGIQLGIAFQLQDDLLDAFSEEDKFGKVTGGDIVANKKTFLLLKALELATGETKKELLNWITITDFDSTEKINAVKKIYTELNIDQITRSEIETYYQKALRNMDKLNVASKPKDELIDLAQAMMQRDH